MNEDWEDGRIEDEDDEDVEERKEGGLWPLSGIFASKSIFTMSGREPWPTMIVSKSSVTTVSFFIYTEVIVKWLPLYVTDFALCHFPLVLFYIYRSH